MGTLLRVVTLRNALRVARLVAAPCLAAAPLCATAQNSPVRPGDRVLLRILRDTLIQDTLRVDPRGFVVVPFAGDIRLGDIPGDAVQDTIRAHLTRFTNPNVVEAIVLRRVRVVGEVAKPGVYYIDRTASLRDAVAMAGGVTTIGYEKRLTLLRGDRRTEFTDWRSNPDAAKSVESGDELTVGRLPWYQRELLSIVTGVGILASIIITLSR